MEGGLVGGLEGGGVGIGDEWEAEGGLNHILVLLCLQ